MQNTHDLAAFRQGIRDFVRQRLPDDLRQTVRRGQQPTRDQLVAWHDVLAGEGLLVPHWPETWGGRGWNVQQQMVFDEEMALGDAPE
ncbi:MAG: acyl-CoA dehydrogenase family protein, partial [Ottowia sp.]|nr:acyl-CoA dehydrogenase family protein [Ottowia sp.]